MPRVRFSAPSPHEAEPSSVALSVIAPVYRCAPCIREFWKRTQATLEGTGESWEVVFVDDRSPDESWPILQDLAAENPEVQVVRLSRNFGQHRAITAGLAAARGEQIVVIDCDLEDPPEQIPQLLATARRTGNEIVLTRRADRTASWFRRTAAGLYARLLTRLTQHELDSGYGTYSLVSRRVRDEVLRFTDQDRHYLHLLFWLGFDRSVVEIAQGERFAGTSSYTFGKLVQHAVSGLMFHTTVLLRWIVYLGFTSTLVGFVIAAALIANRIANNVMPGWTSLAVIMLCVGGMIICCVGVIGLYVGRIYDEVRRRPLFVVDERLGSLAATGASDEADRGARTTSSTSA